MRRGGAANDGQGQPESEEQEQMNHYAVKNIVAGFFQNTGGTKGARDKTSTGLLGDETWNDGEQENQESCDVEGHDALYYYLWGVLVARAITLCWAGLSCCRSGRVCGRQ